MISPTRFLRLRKPTLVLAWVLLGLSLSVQAQTANPLEGDGRAIRGGGGLFRAQCATCHGADAKGIDSIDAPDLTQMWSNRSLSASDVFETIRDGVPGSIMPPHSFTDTELWMLVAYLQSIAVSGVIGLPAGDSAAGAATFAETCARCHRAYGEGGSLGPNLSGITTRRSLESLTASVREPDLLIARGFKPVRLITADGQRVTGILKSEDAFSVQVLDDSQRLRAFSKQDLSAFERLSESLMPAFDQSQLSASELNNIFNFLQNGSLP